MFNNNIRTFDDGGSGLVGILVSLMGSDESEVANKRPRGDPDIPECSKLVL